MPKRPCSLLGDDAPEADMAHTGVGRVAHARARPVAGTIAYIAQE
jgi:hypothetical protein